MILTYIILLLFVTVNTKSVVKVSENGKQNVTKRQAEFFPDWVPFKNKQGEELGEFVQVNAKAKPKKRLAPPMNFILRAVAEPEGDDYYDKGQGESDGEEYFEKKEWSDLNRSVESDKKGKEVNHTELSDIDGVVNIITKGKPIPLIKIDNIKTDDKKENSNEEKSEEKLEHKTEENESAENKDPTEKPVLNEENKENKASKSEEDEEYDEESNVKPKSEVSTTTTTTEKTEEQKQDEAKKAKILNEVDDLKERHAEEQRLISEKVREEEEFERNKLQINSNDKYEDHPTKHKPLVRPDYDEYNEKVQPLKEKYRPQRKSTTPSPTTTQSKVQLENIRTGKLSVFKNPDLFMVYDDKESEEAAPTTKKPRKTKGPRRPTTTPKTQSTQASEESVRISLVPQDNISTDKPTLFFPKRKKNKSRRKLKSTTDSEVEESRTAKNVTDVELATLVPSVTAFEATAQIPAVSTFSGVTKIAPDTTASAASSPVTGEVKNIDAVAASTQHKKEEKKHENYEHERGGGRDYRSQHVEDHGEEGKKAYEGFHENTKTEKGHLEKEDHQGKYDDNGGYEKNHHNEKDYYGGHHHEEHGKKNAKYEESGKHSKGHNTKGSHDIHKKEEYEKKVEFFEEDGDSAEDEKFGGFNSEHEHASGGKFSKGNSDAGHHHKQKGDAGHFGKGGHEHIHKGHHSAGGHDGHGHGGHEAFHKKDHQAGKKWVYHHGTPAKHANLLVIDRRADKYTHGPHYYG